MLRSCRALAILPLVGLLTVAAPVHTSAAEPHLPAMCTTIVRDTFAFAMNGIVFRANADGTGRCRLTTEVNALEPHLSPDGHRVAFLAGAGTFGTGNGKGNTVRIAPVGRPASTGFVVRADVQLHGWLAWSSTGRRLAFRDGHALWVWGTGCGCARRMVRGMAVMPSTESFAWSPDGREIAAALFRAQAHPTTQLRLAVVNAATVRTHIVRVTFPQAIEGIHPYSGSYPSRVLGWKSGGRILIGTSGWGVGVSLTSIWDAPEAGGPAHLLVGTRVQGHVAVRFPLLNSTSALLSPRATRLVLDPNNRFWISSPPGASGRTVNPGIHGSCALAQFSWIDETRLAFVTVCTVPNNNSIPVLARLFTISAAGGHPRLVATVLSPSQQQNNLSIAPVVRCIACGAG
jgi:hypothetical protein